MILATALAAAVLLAPARAQVAQSHKLPNPASHAAAAASGEQVAQSHEVLAPASLVAVGDVASCRSTGDEATAAVAARLPGTIALLGDVVYEAATDAEFRSCFAPSWGRLKGRIRPAPGNHEYGTPRAAGYFRYFGRAAGDPRRGYYAYRLGDWQVVVLNTNCARAGGCGAGSPQERWLRGVLASSDARCTLAYGHHPRLSSGFHGPDRSIQALWRALQDAGAELYLAGHDHHYERFAPSEGLRQFVVGTGGRSHYPVVRRLASSRARWAGGYGVLALRLRPDGYDWRFVPVAGETYTDAGSAACG